MMLSLNIAMAPMMPPAANRNENAEKSVASGEIANSLPGFLEVRGFTPELSGYPDEFNSPVLGENVRSYYRDYVYTPRLSGYRSMHITLYDNQARCFTEMQLRTKDRMYRNDF